jgi:IS30 family transposase
MSYRQLTHRERYQIAALRKARHNQNEIAVLVGVHKSTISRELRRNRGGRGYQAGQADIFARRHKEQRARTPRLSEETWQLVEDKLRQEWSPQQISGWLSRHTLWRISHEWIYRCIWADKRRGGTLHRHLRWRKKYRKRYGGRDLRGRIAHRISIEQRPPVVEERSRIGDWELDTIVGVRGGSGAALVSLCERKSRLTLLAKVEKATAQAVSDAIVKLLRPLQKQVFTLTSDNGREFSGHRQIARKLQADFYFAHPYCSWERGLNENTNGLVRQYFPKGSDLKEATPEKVQEVVDRLNHRPRRCLNFATPQEDFDAPQKSQPGKKTRKSKKRRNQKRAVALTP